MKESCYNRKGMKTTHLCVYFGCLTGILSIECWYYWYCDYKKKCTYLFFHPFPDTVPKNLSICDVMRTIKVSFGMWSWWLWKTLMSPEKWKLKVISLSCFRLFATPMDCSLPGSPIHGILQARMLEWVSVPFSRGSSWPRDWTQVSCIGRRVLYH